MNDKTLDTRLEQLRQAVDEFVGSIRSSKLTIRTDDARTLASIMAEPADQLFQLAAELKDLVRSRK